MSPASKGSLAFAWVLVSYKEAESTLFQEVTYVNLCTIIGNYVQVRLMQCNCVTLGVRYINEDPLIVPMLKMLRQSGRKTFLVTNRWVSRLLYTLFQWSVSNPLVLGYRKLTCHSTDYQVTVDVQFVGLHPCGHELLVWKMWHGWWHPSR
jgi:hypothetical protein